MKTKLFALIFFFFCCLSFVQAAENTSFEDLLQSARQGDLEAMCDVGIAYYKGEQTLKDPFKAKCWIQKAFQNGSDRAEELWNRFELWKYSGRCEEGFDTPVYSRHAAGDVFIEPVTGIRFIYIPRGCFAMGCHENAGRCSKDETPEHKVCLDGFWMSRYEITQEQWRRIMGTNPSRFTHAGNLPVENVSYNDVYDFISKANSLISGRMELPTEAQWEYAARSGGADTEFPWENESTTAKANCGTCIPARTDARTMPVDSFTPNPFGLYNMAGNVKEWCRDYYDKKAYFQHAKKNPVYDERESTRVIRGGSWADNLSKLRCTARDKSIPLMKSDTTGFRLILIKQTP